MEKQGVVKAGKQSKTDARCRYPPAQVFYDFVAIWCTVKFSLEYMKASEVQGVLEIGRCG